MSNKEAKLENINNFVTDTLNDIHDRMSLMVTHKFTHEELDTYYFGLLSSLISSRLLLDLNTLPIGDKPPTDQAVDELQLLITETKGGLVDSINRGFEGAFKMWNGLDCMYHTSIDVVDDGSEQGTLH